MSETTTSERPPRAPRSPEREQRRLQALRHVRQYPDPVLRRTAEPVAVFDEELVALVERMYSIMSEAVGVGLAAPQLGLLQRIFTYQIDEDEGPEALANPEVTWRSDDEETDEEGCLSLGDAHVQVSRPRSIKVTGQRVDGSTVELDLEGYAARVFQHEIDHLDGVLMFDRAVDDDERKQALAYLRPKP